MLASAIWAVGILTSNTAFADRISRLVEILETDPSYKVRVQVALALGKLKDPKAVQPLIRALKDPHHSVRAIAAASLGQLNDRKAVPELQQRLRVEKDRFVKAQIKKAIALLEEVSIDIAPGTRFFITLGKTSSASTRGGTELANFFGQTLIKEFRQMSGFAIGNVEAGHVNALKKKNIQAFILDGAITELTHTPSGNEVEVSCQIKVSLSTFPDNSMKAFYTGGAGTIVSARSLTDPKSAQEIYRDVIAGAAQGAREHIINSYFRHQ